MRTTRRVLRPVLIVLAMTADLSALAICLTRPPDLFAEHLGLGPTDQSPLRRFVAWTHGRVAPWTPLGFLSIFEPIDLVLLVTLVFVLVVLVALLGVTWAGDSRTLLARMRERIRRPPPMHFRMSAALAAVAILGLEFGWEVNGRASWRLRERYLGRINQFARQAEEARREASKLRGEISRIESRSDPGQWAVENLTQEAISASRAAMLVSRVRNSLINLA
jgi:hypothetical protein